MTAVVPPFYHHGRWTIPFLSDRTFFEKEGETTSRGGKYSRVDKKILALFPGFFINAKLKVGYYYEGHSFSGRGSKGKKSMLFI